MKFDARRGRGAKARDRGWYWGHLSSIIDPATFHVSWADQATVHLSFRQSQSHEIPRVHLRASLCSRHFRLNPRFVPLSSASYPFFPIFLQALLFSSFSLHQQRSKAGTYFHRARVVLHSSSVSSFPFLLLTTITYSSSPRPVFRSAPESSHSVSSEHPWYGQPCPNDSLTFFDSR